MKMVAKRKGLKPETEAELFQYWRNLGRTPELLIGNFLIMNNIYDQERRTRLERIIKYARLFSVEGVLDETMEKSHE